MMIEKLRRWFLRNRRNLPWRENRTPYRVWISEVMLQQTRAEVVIDYFERWMERFPSISCVADAELEDIIKAWEGLGYYSRARNIHTSARAMRAKFPETYDELIALKGFGEYTVGAVLSFAFKKKQPAIDGNVSRVLSRLFAVKEEISSSAAKKQIVGYAWKILPEKAPWEITEGLIELGALVCKKKPLCEKCPLRSSCRAFKEGVAEALPRKKPKKAVEILNRSVAVIESPFGLLVEKKEEGRVMADLWEFPYRDLPFNWKTFHLSLTKGAALAPCTHTFTRFKALLSPTYYKVDNPFAIPGFTWVNRRAIVELPFSSGHKKILHSVLKLDISL